MVASSTSAPNPCSRRWSSVIAARPALGSRTLRAPPGSIFAGHDPQRDGRPRGDGIHRQPAHLGRPRAHAQGLPLLRRHAARLSPAGARSRCSASRPGCAPTPPPSSGPAPPRPALAAHPVAGVVMTPQPARRLPPDRVPAPVGRACSLSWSRPRATSEPAYPVHRAASSAPPALSRGELHQPALAHGQSFEDMRRDLHDEPGKMPPEMQQAGQMNQQVAASDTAVNDVAAAIDQVLSRREATCSTSRDLAQRRGAAPPVRGLRAEARDSLVRSSPCRSWRRRADLHRRGVRLTRPPTSEHGDRALQARAAWSARSASSARPAWPARPRGADRLLRPAPMTATSELAALSPDPGTPWTSRTKNAPVPADEADPRLATLDAELEAAWPAPSTRHDPAAPRRRALVQPAPAHPARVLRTNAAALERCVLEFLPVSALASTSAWRRRAVPPMRPSSPARRRDPVPGGRRIARSCGRSAPRSSRSLAIDRSVR